MKRLADWIKITNNYDGTVVDEFVFYADGNHASISNKQGCLFDGYYPEAVEEFANIYNDMKVCERFGFTIEKK